VCYGLCMRTTIDLDDQALDAAQRELGTTSMKDTVNAALAYTAARGSRAAQRVNNAFDFWGADVADAETMRQARR
jgi:Arc/MetJ family transcription regulator